MSLVVLKAHCRLLLPLNLGAGAAADVLVLAVTCFFVAADYCCSSNGPFSLLEYRCESSAWWDGFQQQTPSAKRLKRK